MTILTDGSTAVLKVRAPGADAVRASRMLATSRAGSLSRGTRFRSCHVLMYKTTRSESCPTRLARWRFASRDALWDDEGKSGAGTLSGESRFAVGDQDACLPVEDDK